MTFTTNEQKVTVREAIGTAIGEASMCWDPPPGGQIFESTRASKICDRLVDLFEENMKKAYRAGLNDPRGPTK